MTDFRTFLADLRRPRLLIRAARHGLQDYSRDRDLRRVLGHPATLSPEHTLASLIEREGAMEETRRSGEAGYSIARHIEVLIALLAEAHLLPQRSIGA